MENGQSERSSHDKYRRNRTRRSVKIMIGYTYEWSHITAQITDV